ncbi:Hypothetical protein UVM_LOCUS335 [uncultured virus]|nr:Hypothetical protein UVM_LOCUS335 [uncultured virus]
MAGLQSAGLDPRDDVAKLTACVEEGLQGFLQFHQRNGYIDVHELHLSAYMRVWWRFDAKARVKVLTLEIVYVHVEQEHRSRGNFKRFLRAVEAITQNQERWVMVECVQNELLLEHLKGCGYMTKYEGDITVWKRPW